MVCLDKEVLPKSITAKKLNAKICDDVKSIMRLTLILGRSSPWKFSLYYSITIIANFLRLFIYLNSDIMTVAYCVICNFPVFWQLSICYFRPNYIRVPYSLPYFTFTYNLSFSKKLFTISSKSCAHTCEKLLFQEKKLLVLANLLGIWHKYVSN